MASDTAPYIKNRSTLFLTMFFVRTTHVLFSNLQAEGYVVSYVAQMHLSVATSRPPHILRLDPQCVVSERPTVPFGWPTRIHLFVHYYVLLRELSFWFSRFVLRNYQSFPIRSCQDWVTQDRSSHTIYVCISIF